MTDVSGLEKTARSPRSAVDDEEYEYSTAGQSAMAPDGASTPLPWGPRGSVVETGPVERLRVIVAVNRAVSAPGRMRSAGRPSGFADRNGQPGVPNDSLDTPYRVTGLAHSVASACGERPRRQDTAPRQRNCEDLHSTRCVFCSRGGSVSILRIGNDLVLPQSREGEELSALFDSQRSDFGVAPARGSE